MIFLRLKELQAISVSLGSSDSYFKADDDKLTTPHKRDFFLAIERDLIVLDAKAWEDLKNEALPKLTVKVPGRGWEPLFSILNQARGYNYLAAHGCTDIEFIPRAPSKTPDLKAKYGGMTVLCEVKTIHVSQDEVERRLNGGVITITTQIASGFFNKLRSDIDEAVRQMEAFESKSTARHVAYVVINFDDVLHEYATQYEAQICADLAINRRDGVKVVLDIKPPFCNAART